MKLWEWVQYTVWDIRGRLGDEDAAAHAQALWEVTHSTDPKDTEINLAVDSQVVAGPRIWIFSDLLDAVKGAGEGVGGLFKGLGNLAKFLGRNIIGVLIAAALLMGLWYILVLKKTVGK